MKVQDEQIKKMLEDLCRTLNSAYRASESYYCDCNLQKAIGVVDTMLKIITFE